MVKKKVQPIGLALIALVLFQGCRVYSKEHTTLDKAVDTRKRVKMITSNGQKLKYQKIVLDNGSYYGVQNVKGKDVRMRIEPASVESLHLHNKTMSIIYGTGIGFIITGVVSGFIAIATYDGPIDIAPQAPN